MSYPILYSATETKFDHNGIGILGNCVFCEVTEEANGIFELAMQYPIDGVHYEQIVDRSIIKAKSDQFRDPQLFRVYSISRPMSGIVKIFAEHISYELSGIPVKPFTVQSAALALSGLKNNAVVDCPFDFWTDKATAGTFRVVTPSSIRSRLGGVAGSILDVYGGEYEFDNFTVKLHKNRGMNRGVSIRYGKNLTDIQQDQNCSSVATGIYPYWSGDVDGTTVVVELPEKIINAPGTYNFVKIRTVDFSAEFETKPTVEQLRTRAERYVTANNIGVPAVSWTVSFEQLSKSEEYKHLALLERVSLFDTVNVEFPALGVSATAKAVKVVYDVIAERVVSVTLGSVRANIADTIANQNQAIQDQNNAIAKKPGISVIESAIEKLTSSIIGAKGGSVRLLDTDDDGEPDTLYIADNPDPEKAIKVWRFNYEGWGASENGYNGPFRLGATLDGGIVADFITAGTLYGLLIKAGSIESLDGKINIDLSGGSDTLFNSGIIANSIQICKESNLDDKLFWLRRNNYEGSEYFVMQAFSRNGKEIATIQENIDAKSTFFSIAPSVDTNSFAYMSSTSDNAVMGLFCPGSYLQFGVSQPWGGAFLALPGDEVGAKVLSWSKNEDGTYSLIGRNPII